jgi:FtsP/CotA-like multicopper oxidase with cupredoxin domain
VRTSIRVTIAVVASLAVLGPLTYFFADSLVPSTYDMATMGYADLGGGPDVHRHGSGGLSVADLKGPSGPAQVSVTLTARKEGNRFTLNHRTPGPEIRAKVGDLIQVTLINESVPDGVTLHWHGVDVPNAEDGVAGVTQDAVKKGGRYEYRFVAQDAGTFWYHSHQVSHEEVRQGLLGPLVIEPKTPLAVQRDPVLTVHTYDGKRGINGTPGVSALVAQPGQRIRARVINTDPAPFRAWVSGADYTVAAVDGREVHGAQPVAGKEILVTAGGRVDLEFTVPPSGAVRVDVGGGVAAAAGNAPAAAEPAPVVDLLTYGSPAPLGFDPAKADRHFQYKIGKGPGFLDGKPGLWWTINGHLWPDVPMFMVSTGDVVKMTIANSSGEVHPMHLHGHHAVVLSRNGVAATGAPWWFDSLDVADGDTYEVAFVADNPGIWVDHCHNLKHAADGLLAHLAYSDVTTPYRVGGKAGNTPE